MGSSWGWSSKQGLLDYLSRDDRVTAGYKFIKRRVVGSNHWYVLERPDGSRFIGLDLLLYSRAERDWGYKPLTEDMGPTQVSCPLSLLKLVEGHPTNDFGTNWREAVRQYHAKRSQRPAWQVGMVIEFGEHMYRLVEPLGHGRRGWRVVMLVATSKGICTGVAYRVSTHQMARAKLVDPSTLPSLAGI